VFAAAFFNPRKNKEQSVRDYLNSTEHEASPFTKYTENIIEQWH
jgi:hypothetical protein